MAGLLDDEAQGLSPQAKQALYLTRTRDIPEQFQNAAMALKTEMSRRGALSNELPASGGDLVRAFGPLYAAQNRAFSDANIDTILADEEMKKFNRTQNLQFGGQGAAGLAGLMGQVGDIYDPSPFIAGAGNGLMGLIDAFRSGDAPLNAAINAAGGRGDLEDGSFMSLLKSSLLSTGLAQLPALLELIKNGGNGGGNGGGGGGGVSITPNINIGGETNTNGGYPGYY